MCFHFKLILNIKIYFPPYISCLNLKKGYKTISSPSSTTPRARTPNQWHPLPNQNSTPVPHPLHNFSTSHSTKTIFKNTLPPLSPPHSEPTHFRLRSNRVIRQLVAHRKPRKDVNPRIPERKIASLVIQSRIWVVGWTQSNRPLIY